MFKGESVWVKFKAQSTTTPTCIVQKYEDKYAAMMSFIPYVDSLTSIEDVEGIGEFWLVLDRSGSMSGTRIEMAKQATIVFLKSLTTGSTFNIVSFGSSYSYMFYQPIINNQENVQRAISEVQRFSADMGGTEIYKPLNSIFSKASSNERPRIIILLTDGEVSNSAGVINLIKAQAGNSKVHSIGIGNSVDRYLITESAKAGRGSASFVTNSNEIGKKVIGALKKCLLPCVNSWEISWPGECYPKTENLGFLYYGEKCVQYILLDSIPTSPLEIRFYDNYKNAFLAYSLSNFQIVPGNNIIKLWGKNKIDFLNEKQQENKFEIIKISKSLGIPSELTSFICIKENENPVEGDMITKKIPQARPFGLSNFNSAYQQNLFGSSNIHPSNQPNLFGSLSPNPYNQPSLFGISNINPRTQPYPYGSSNMNTMNQPILLGSSNAYLGNQTSIFGSSGAYPNNQSSLFRSSNVNPNLNQANLIRPSNTNQSYQTGLFGSSNINPSPNQTSLFGSSNMNPSPNQTGLFGSSNINPSPNQASLFGSSNINPSHQSNLFGSSNMSPQNPLSMPNKCLTGGMQGFPMSSSNTPFDPFATLSNTYNSSRAIPNPTNNVSLFQNSVPQPKKSEPEMQNTNLFDPFSAFEMNSAPMSNKPPVNNVFQSNNIPCAPCPQSQSLFGPSKNELLKESKKPDMFDLFSMDDALKPTSQFAEQDLMNLDLNMDFNSSKPPKNLKSFQPQTKSNNIYIDVISVQLAQGFWEYQSISQLFPEIKNIPKDLFQISEDLKLDVISTVFVLAYLYKYYSEKHEEWELVERKTNKWLKSMKISFEPLREVISNYV
ncbi:hypothetical protein SteCoe_37895 [Stentor coeruleus]|uniref:VWFA domain-containing protein n=1 Tax=Stentor coeruleus TaxID=5963 RepID=A0A1R2AM69_9CILI|nr:hypothetical protein SteCoe_37895 [Stentor coeruleus]